MTPEKIAKIIENMPRILEQLKQHILEDVNSKQNKVIADRNKTR